MQGAISSHLLKRGLHFANNCMKNKKVAQAAGVDKWIQVQNTQSPAEEMAKRFQQPGAIVALGLTLIVFIIVSAAAEYAIRFVATNLAIVENTEDTGRIALTADEPDATLSKTGLLDDCDEEQKLLLSEPVPVKPITRKLRTTFQHLASIGGFRARFRGIRNAAFYQMVLLFFIGIFNVVFAFMGPFGMWAANTAAAVVCCNVHAAWTHATIAAPTTNKRFFERFLPRSEATKLILPTLRLHLTIGMMNLAVFGTTYAAVVVFHQSKAPHWVSANLAFLPIASAILTAILLVIPSYIALIRTEASLMPEDMAAIVPFDRSFGGRLVEETSARPCRFFKSFTVRGAWTQFSRETYKRVLKMQVKFVWVSLGLAVLFGAVLGTEAYIIAGGKDEIRKLWVYYQATRQ